MKTYTSFLLLIPVALSLTGCPKNSTVSSESADPCSGRQKIVLVKLKSEKLYLCKNGSTVNEYDVAIGKGGYGKTLAGDNKTPIGTYNLFKPRESGQQFHTFIPVDYPTPEQTARGYTGKYIGIHGPHQSWKWLGGATTWSNWTQGCVAVSSNQKIDEIAAWVKSEKVNTVDLEI